MARQLVAGPLPAAGRPQEVRTSDLVSVIIPAFEAATTIGETLRSVLGQTHRPIEVIVVDDGSSDETGRITRTFGEAVRYVRQTNAGDAAARNTGIRHAIGSYLAFLDADDLWRPTKLEAQMALLAAEPSIGAAQCGAVFVDEELRPLEIRTCRPGRLDLWDVLCFRNLPAFSSSVLMRRSCLERIGETDLSVRGKDEWDLAIRVTRWCSLACVAEPLVLRRVHGASASRQVAYAERQIRPGLEILGRLFADPTLPPAIRQRRRRAYAAFYRMIAGSYLEGRRLPEAFLWLGRAIASDPRELAYALALPLRRARRKA